MTLRTLSKTMNHSKVYAVIEYGGEWEDFWEHILGVCSTPELADTLKNKIEESHSRNINISYDEWEEMYDKLSEYEEKTGDEFDNILDGLLFLFPGYEAKDIEEAVEKYFYQKDDYVGVRTEEINFFDNLSDISNEINN